jgi:SAM-dependent methyltransferase
MSLELLGFDYCPACGCEIARSRILFPVSLFGTECNVRKCADCGLVFKDQRPSESSLLALYAADYVHFQPPPAPGAAETNSVRQKLRRCMRLMPARAPRSGLRVLDVGCGTGSVVNIARSMGYAAEGIDPHLPPHLENRFLKRGGLDDLAEGQFDVVLLLNVAEHVVQPRSLFASARRVLRDAGVMLVTCPYGESAALRFHRSRWTHLALDEHLLFWTPRSLGRLLAEVGFDGPSSWRIAGSPFPFGLAARAPAPAPPGPSAPPGASAPAASILARGQRRLWTLARWLQRSDRAAVAVQAMVHALRIGDYLEYGVGVRKT